MNVALAVVAVAAVVIAVGLGGALAVSWRRRHANRTSELIDEFRRVAAEAREQQEQARDSAITAAIGHLTTTNKAVFESQHAQGAKELDNKKSLIDQQLATMTSELGKVTSLVESLERDREQKFGELSAQLVHQREGLAELTNTAQGLRDTLSSSKARGQWGERMAEDVLRLAGFVENINYQKQRAVASGGVPDFTFLLPNDVLLHMDVKFPLDNYRRYVESDSDLERKQFRDAFLRDVRDRVSELGSRDYIDPSSTVDCVLLFIPNEQLYAFIHEQDDRILDEALRKKIVLCSPLTLFAVLAVIRQSVQNFQLERVSNQILDHLARFAKQWERFSSQMDKLGKKIHATGEEFDRLEGTRRRMLERELDRIEALRSERALDTGEGDGGDEDGSGPVALEA